jgi:EmrB/QacA subfamily drug resistance transporter
MAQPVTPATVPAPHPNPNRWRILGLLGVAQLMLILDVTVVTIALPNISADLGLGRQQLTWVVSGYTLAFGGLLLLGGRAADLFGARRLVVLGLSVFAAASLLAGLAPTGWALLAGRVLQGLAAAFLSPSALSLVVRTFDGAERDRALGIWSALGGGGAALGVLLGGLLTAGPGWSWVFFVNVPVGVLLALTLHRALPPDAPGRSPGRLDLLGAALVTAATGTLIYALIQAGDRGWTSAVTGLLAATAVALYLAFVVRIRHAAYPLMDLGLLLRRPVAVGTLLVLVATALMITVFFLGSFYFQRHLGYDALRTGLLFLPVALATMAGATIAGRVLARTGPRLLGPAGLVVGGIGMWVAAAADGPTTLVAVVAVAAAGTGAVFVVASATALGQVGPHEAGLASGIVSTFHEFGASLGAAVVSSIAAASLAGTSAAGVSRGFATAAVVAAVAAVVTLAIAPGRRGSGDPENGDDTRPDVTIRPAAAADVPAIARIWLEGWPDGHEGHVPAALVAERTPASFDERARARVGQTWVVDSGGTVAGFVVVVDDEVEQVYVDRRWRGRGVAERLLRHAEAVISQGGRRTAWLAVVAGNTRARRFYARLGWQDRGPFTYEAQTATGTFPVPAHRYERELGSTLRTTSQPQSLLRRRWATLAGLGFAALVAFDLVSGVELAPVLAASAAVYLGAAALRRPAAAWPLFFATVVVITVARLLEDRLEPTWVILVGAVALGSTAYCAGPPAPATGCRCRPWPCSALAPPPAPPCWSTPSSAPTWWPPASSATPPGTPTTTGSTGSSSAPWPSSASCSTPRWRWRS